MIQKLPEETTVLNWAGMTAVVAVAAIPMALAMGYLFDNVVLYRLWALALAVAVDAGLVAGVTPSGRSHLIEAAMRLRYGQRFQRPTR